MLAFSSWARVARAFSSAAEGAAKAPTSRRGKNLFELAALLPERGVGSRFVRKSWLRNGYADAHWTITRIRFEPDGRHGDAWGMLTWNGHEKKAMGRVRGSLKREWRYVDSLAPAAMMPSVP